VTEIPFDKELDLAKTMFEEFRPRPPGFGPTARLSSPEGDVIALIEGAETSDMRRAALAVLIVEHRATRVVFMSDAWVKSFKGAEAAAAREYEREHPGRVEKLPAEYDDKTEALIVSVVTPDGWDCRYMPYRMVDNQVVWELHDIKGADMESPLLDAAQKALRAVARVTT
jgi:hypothetical protein